MKSTVKAITFEYLSTVFQTPDMRLNMRSVCYLLCLSRIQVMANCWYKPQIYCLFLSDHYIIFWMMSP